MNKVGMYWCFVLLTFLGVKNSYSQANYGNEIAKNNLTNSINPLRGFFSWYNQSIVPLNGIPTESYMRFSWMQLERGEGEYDFSVIDNNLSKLEPGQRLAFGVMALNTCCGAPNGIEVPNYIVQKPGKAFSTYFHGKKIFIPDWNDPYFLDRVEKLFQALGKRYNGDPRIAWVEIRMYGDWGEWHLGNLSDSYSNIIINKLYAKPATLISKERIILAQIAPFSKTQLLMMTADSEALLFALRQQTNIPIGMRRDSWGSVQFERDFFNPGTSEGDKKLILERWKMAPFIIETYGGDKSFEVGAGGIVKQVVDYHVSAIANGGFVGKIPWDTFSAEQKQALILSGLKAGYNLKIINVDYTKSISSKQLFSIDSKWFNSGSAPVYEKWKVQFQLLRSVRDLKPVWSGYSKINLSSIMPAINNFYQADKFILPSDLSPGNYILAIRIIDPLNYKLPMNLLNNNKLPNNAYFLGNMVIK